MVCINDVMYLLGDRCTDLVYMKKMVLQIGMAAKSEFKQVNDRLFTIYQWKSTQSQDLEDLVFLHPYIMVLLLCVLKKQRLKEKLELDISLVPMMMMCLLGGFTEVCVNFWNKWTSFLHKNKWFPCSDTNRVVSWLKKQLPGKNVSPDILQFMFYSQWKTDMNNCFMHFVLFTGTTTFPTPWVFPVFFASYIKIVTCEKLQVFFLIVCIMFVCALVDEPKCITKTSTCERRIN
jgi:hypothetical protein